MIIEAKELCKIYRVKKSNKFFGKGRYIEKKAVKNVNFSVGQGEMMAYIGVNGAGKSTTIKMLTGILLPTSGEITVLGKNPYDYRKTIAKEIGVVFGQRSQLIWDLPVFDSFKLFSKIYNLSNDSFVQRMNYIYQEVGIEELMSIPVRKLSLGQRMCCEIAIATLHNPQILVLDEPTIGLDIFNKDKIREFINSLNRKYNTTLFLTTHDLGDVEAICNKLVLLNHGRIIYEGTISHLKDQYGLSNKVMLKFDTIDMLNATNFNEYQCEKNYEECSITISYDKEQNTSKEMLQYISQRCSDFKDITIMQPDLEEIIKNFHIN